MDPAKNPFLQTLRLPVVLSPMLVKIVILFHVVTVFLPWFSGLDTEIRLLLSSIPVFSLMYYFIKYGLANSDGQVSELILSSNDNWQVKLKNGLSYDAEVGSALFIHPLLIIINLKYNKLSRNFIFTSETISADKLRRLRVRLKYETSPE